MPQGPPGGPWPGGATGGSAGQATLGPTAVAGTVLDVNGDTLTIRTFSGETVSIHVSSTTHVRKSQAGSIEDLAAGASIIVIGQPDGLGGFTAVRVIEGAAAPAR